MTTHSHTDEDSEGLGWRFWLGLVAVTIAFGLGLVLAMILFGLAWYEWGFVGAAIILVAVTCGVKALQDRRARRQWS